MTACDCGTVAFAHHTPDCALVRARKSGKAGAHSIELVSWFAWVENHVDLVSLIWCDTDEIERKCVLEVDHDIDGESFHHKSGEALPDDDDDREELLSALSSDMAMHRGSEFVPVRAYCYRKHREHQEIR